MRRFWCQLLDVFCWVSFLKGSPLLDVLCRLPLPVFVMFDFPEGSPLVVVLSVNQLCSLGRISLSGLKGEVGLITPVTFDVLVYPSFGM